MNIGELLREREKWEEVLKKAPLAKAKIRQIDRIIVLMGDLDESVDLEPVARANGTRKNKGTHSPTSMSGKVLLCLHRMPDEKWLSSEVHQDIEAEYGGSVPTQTVGSALARLSREGLVKATFHPESSQKKLYQITGKGVKFVEDSGWDTQ